MQAWVYMIAATIASPAGAQDRNFCADRPGLNTPPCTIAPGKVMIEVGVGDWIVQRTPTTRTDILIVADTLVRVGIADHAEIGLGWTAAGHVRQRDHIDGTITSSSGSGDIRIGLSRNISNPDGSGTSIAVLSYATIPVGGSTIGAGDWAAGVQLPMSFELSERLAVVVTPTVNAAVDQDRRGRHLSYGSAAGISWAISNDVSIGAETLMIRDNDQSGNQTLRLAGFSIAWQPDPNSQLDFGTNLGLNRASPDIQLYAGVSRRF